MGAADTTALRIAAPDPAPADPVEDLIQGLKERPEAGMPPLLLTPVEAARYLKISPRKLWQLTHDGDIRSLKIGRLVRYDTRDLIRFVDGLK